MRTVSRYSRVGFLGLCGWLGLQAVALPAEPAGADAAATTATGDSLAFRKAPLHDFLFDTGALRGVLCREGKPFGLAPMESIRPAAPVARAYGIFSPYRILTSQTRYGHAAWELPSTAELLGDGAVRVSWPSAPERPFQMAALYRWKAQDTLDLTITVRAGAHLPKFEVFLASYFQGFSSLRVYVAENPQAGGKPGLLEADRSYGAWQMFPRDKQSEKIIGDGRWTFPPNPVQWKIMPRLAGALALRRDEKSGLTALVMARPDDCFAISGPCNEDSHRSVYLSLLGRDLEPNQTALARARLVVAAGISDGQAVARYQRYVEERD